MAYNFTQVTDDEEQQKQAPGAASTGAPAPQAPSIGSVMGGGGSSAPQAPKVQSAQEQHGTGFTGLKSWLDAGAGRSGNIKSAADSGYSTEKGSLDKAVTDTDAEIAKHTPITAAGSATALLDQEAQGVKTNLGDIVNQHYDGPQGLTWQSGQGATDLGLLSNKDTAADVTAKDAIAQGGYGRGMRALDAALYGADPESIAAMGGASGSLTKLGSEAHDAGVLTQAHAQNAGFRIDDARNAARKELEDQRTSLGNALDSRAFIANQKLQQGFDDNTPAAEGMLRGGWAGALPGSANRENVSGDSERAQFNALDRFLGGGGAQMHEGGGSTAVTGHREITADPNFVANLPVTPVGKKLTRKMVMADPGAKQRMGAGQILGGIFTGGIANVIAAKKASDDAVRNHGVDPYTDHMGWVDENGKEVDPYRFDPLTGQFVDEQTGEKINKSDTENGSYEWDAGSGKYKRKKG